MSTRQLRRLQEKLQKASDKGLTERGDSDSGTDEDPEIDKGALNASAPFNPFDLLSDDEKPEPSKEAESDDSDEEVTSRFTPNEHMDGLNKQQDQQRRAMNAQQHAARKSKKKKQAAAKKKAAGKTAPGLRTETGDSGSPSRLAATTTPKIDGGRGTAKESALDDIDLLIKELDLHTVGGASSSKATNVASLGPLSTSEAEKASANQLLSVDIRSLRGDDELRRIFGADVVQSVDRQDVAEAAHRRRHVHAVRGMPGQGRRRPLKRGLLVTPKDHWPPFDGGLSMELTAATSGSFLTDDPGIVPVSAPFDYQYREGEKVYYVTREKALVPATIVHVDISAEPAQYGIKREPASTAEVGQQQQGVLYTEHDRLRPLTAVASANRAAGRQKKQLKGPQTMFKYCYSSSYRTTQLLFEQAQATHDPNSIAALLQQAPYHVDALLAMYDLYRHMGENSYAEECLARALYSLEMGWHPAFDIGSANCRLDFEVEENRALFVALFRHIQALSRQGCHRTALECCKLLLALEPEDPMGALQLVDYLALRAGKPEYLLDFVSGYDNGGRSLSLLPNYVYTTPMALWRIEQQQQQQLANCAGPTASSCDAVLEGGSVLPPVLAQRYGSALEAAVQAVLLHPLVVPKLLAYLQDKGSGRESHWATLLSKRLFTSADDGGSASLSHLVNIYVERSGLLWKVPEALEMLRLAATLAAHLADGATADAAAAAAASSASGGASGTSEAAGQLLSRLRAAANSPSVSGVSYEDWQCVRREAFPGPSTLEGDRTQQILNEYRHLRLHDFSDTVASLPREEVNAAMAAGGVPEVEDALADMQEQLLAEAQLRRQVQGASTGAPPMSEEELRNTNPLVMLLRSLLPWVNAGQQPEDGADGLEGHRPGP